MTACDHALLMRRLYVFALAAPSPAGTASSLEVQGAPGSTARKYGGPGRPGSRPSSAGSADNANYFVRDLARHTHHSPNAPASAAGGFEATAPQAAYDYSESVDTDTVTTVDSALGAWASAVGVRGPAWRGGGGRGRSGGGG
jgi:hypothetical protein